MSMNLERTIKETISIIKKEYDYIIDLIDLTVDDFLKITHLDEYDIKNIRGLLIQLNILLKQLKPQWEESYNQYLNSYDYFLNNYRKLKVNYNYSLRMNVLINTFIYNLGFTTAQYGGNSNKIYYDSFYSISDSIPQLLTEKKFKFVVIGGGPVGLFMTYKLSLEYPESNILLVDNRIDGEENQRKYTRKNILFKVPSIFISPDMKLSDLHKEHFIGEGYPIYKIEQDLIERIQKIPNISILYSTTDIIQLIYNDTINVDYLLNTTGGRLRQLINDDNIDLINKLEDNPSFDNKIYPIIKGMNKFVLYDEEQNLSYNPKTFNTDRENEQIDYIDISKISSKMPSQVYMTKNGSFFIKFDMGVSYFNTNTSQGDTLYYSIVQLSLLIETLKG